VRDSKLKARNANQKIAKLIRKNPWMEPRAMRDGLLKLRAEPTPIEEKRRRVIWIADTVVKALEPHVACRSGCSHCCHMNTMIYEHEARRLAEVSGRKMAVLPYRPPSVVFSEGMQYEFMPCPFLVADKCSVYDDRPLVCRVHHSLSNLASDCDPLGPGSGRPPMYDPDVIEVPYKLLNESANPMEPMGNIAEFFPDET
jgi:Fe-S-cluster containining protein